MLRRLPIWAVGAAQGRWRMVFHAARLAEAGHTWYASQLSSYLGQAAQATWRK